MSDSNESASTTVGDEEHSASTDVLSIVADGDVVLDVKHISGDITHSVSLRLSASALSTKSKYFERLLQIDRFGEGKHIEQRHTELRQQYPDLKNVPLSKLPVLHIEDLGRISPVKSTAPLLSDFFSILCGKEIPAIPPVVNLANIAIVADRFDALDAIRAYVKRKKTIKAIDGKTTPKQDTALTEERMRQRLLVGLMLDHPSWVEKYSARLITKPSALREVDISEALWWDLPGRIEDELAFRRDCALATIQALQGSFLDVYSTRNRQCRLGYDSSPECDSFQFGEMVRFFIKVGTLRLRGTLSPQDDTSLDYDGDLFLLVERLKQIPEYQVDRNHSHCGIRTRLVPLLELIAIGLQSIGICSDCWLEDWTKHAWMEAKRPLLWKRQRHGPHGANVDHERRHDTVKSLFLAEHRDWT